MWIGDAVLYLVREMGTLALAVPCTLVLLAWVLLLRGQRPDRSIRGLALVWALTFGTIAVGLELALLAWWRFLQPWLYDRPASCTVVPYVGDLMFLTSVASALLSLGGKGPGRLLGFLAATAFLCLLLWGEV
jgi:hypothetical protein